MNKELLSYKIAIIIFTLSKCFPKKWLRTDEYFDNTIDLIYSMEIEFN